MSKDKEADFLEARLDNLIWHYNEKDEQIKNLQEKVGKLHTDLYIANNKFESISCQLIEHNRMMDTVKTLSIIIAQGEK